MNFEYFRADTLEEAVGLLGKYGSDAKVLAGGQSLMPLVNMRLARPAVLVDINRLPALAYVREHDESIAIGAMTRHAAVESSSVVKTALPVVAAATALIGYPSIRSRATFGGSMAHADPAAEYPSVAVALEAELVARSPRGSRSIPASAFFRGYLTTDLAEDELLTEVRLPRQATGVGWAYEELSTRPGDYATVGVLAMLRLDNDGRCRDVRLACTNLGPTPIRARRAEAALTGEPAGHEAFDAAGRLTEEEVEPESDALASAAYKRRMVRVFTRRALEAALVRCR